MPIKPLEELRIKIHEYNPFYPQFSIQTSDNGAIITINIITDKKNLYDRYLSYYKQLIGGSLLHVLKILNNSALDVIKNRLMSYTIDNRNYQLLLGTSKVEFSYLQKDIKLFNQIIEQSLRDLAKKDDKERHFKIILEDVKNK